MSVWTLALGALLLHLYLAAVLWLLAQKLGRSDARLAWVPVANWVLLFRLAGRSGWWSLAVVVPLLNVVVVLLAWTAIAESRGRPWWSGLLVAVPVLGFAVPVYLAVVDADASATGAAARPSRARPSGARPIGAPSSVEEAASRTQKVPAPQLDSTTVLPPDAAPSWRHADAGATQMLDAGPRRESAEGAPGERTVMFRPGEAEAREGPAVRATLVQLDDSGDDLRELPLAGPSTTFGRARADVTFPEDRHMSRTHATLTIGADGLTVEDLGSSNGTFLRLRGPRQVRNGDVILVGEQTLELRHVFEPVDDADDADPGGTVVLGAAQAPTGRMVLVALDETGEAGVRHPVDGTAVIGRADADVGFPEDARISGRHARIRLAEGGAVLEDLGSTNGTYVRIREVTALEHGNELIMGSSRFRVELA